MEKRIICLLTLICLVVVNVLAQEEILLYETVPNSKPAENIEKTEVRSDGVALVHGVSKPSITFFKAAQKSGVLTPAIIICPGGGYRYLAVNKEGTDVATRLNEWGISALVLKYRLPDDRIMQDPAIGPLQDAQRAIQWVREHAAEYGIDPDKVGIMGFSAGGHLASTLSTHFKEPLITNPKAVSLRPDFSVLIYPVISFSDSLTHKGSRTRLIGADPSPEKIAAYSNDLKVNADTPPAFLVHAKDDSAVPWENSAGYYQALRKEDIPARVIYYPTGGHGFGMYNKAEEISWMPELKAWLRVQGVL